MRGARKKTLSLGMWELRSGVMDTWDDAYAVCTEYSVQNGAKYVAGRSCYTVR